MLAEAREELSAARLSHEELQQAGLLARAREDEVLAELASCRSGAAEAEEACAQQLEQLEQSQGRRQWQETELRAELHCESAALTRACERAEEQRMMQQAQLESAQQRVARGQSEEEELRRTLLAQDEAFQKRLAEEHERLIALEESEAASSSKASSPQHSQSILGIMQPGTEREARYAQRLCEQLASLALQKAAPLQPPQDRRRAFVEPALATPCRRGA